MLKNINLNSHFLSQDIPQLLCACFEEANEKLWNRIIRYVIKRPLRKLHCNLIKRININFYMLISMLRKTHMQFKAYLDKEDEYNLSWYFICHGTIPL